MRVQQLQEELSLLTARAKETQRRADALEPEAEEAGVVKVASTADTAARVAKLRAATQTLQVLG